MPFAHPDWFSVNVPNWERWLAHLVGRPCVALEIGSFEGRSALWLVSNVLTDERSRLVCVDPFTHDSMEASITRADAASAYENFEANLLPFRSRVFLARDSSREALRALPADTFELVYIDGSHLARDVLFDAVVSWPLLRSGGTLIFDDYLWTHGASADQLPKVAIDSFIATMRPDFAELEIGMQVCIRKR